MGVIRCEHLVKRYGRLEAVNVEHLSIKENTITGLIGRNSAGKTSLLKLIAGFSRKTSGELSVFGEKPFDNLFVSANSIFVDDEMAFPNNFMLGDILREMANFYPNWDAQLARRLFDHFDLIEGHYHDKLSKGRKNTFNMIVGLSSHAPLTIFDEPTTGMDVAVRKDFYRALLRDYVAHPRTIIISSHHLNEVEDLLERMILLDQGDVLLHESMDTLREYAVRVTGPESEVRKWARTYDVLHEEGMGISDLQVVIGGEYSRKDILARGFTLSNVTPTEVAIYLTKANKGGIDDVFDV